MPSESTYVFYFVCGPASVAYVLSCHLGQFFDWWGSPQGKFVYGVVGAVTITASKVGADQIIRHFIQTEPSHFPSAEQSLSVALAIFLFVYEMSLVILAISLLHTIKVYTLLFMQQLPYFVGFARRKTKSRSVPLLFVNWFVYFTAGIWLTVTLVGSQSLYGLKDERGNPLNILEELIIYSSCLRNKSVVGNYVDEKGNLTLIEKLFCNNIDGEDYVSPAGSRDLISSEVLVAHLRQPIGPIFESRYSYTAAHCTNSNDPGHVQGSSGVQQSMGASVGPSAP